MSGHSKWHNIRMKKMASASARGKAFTKHARLIEIAAREGGGDPASNTRLRSAIDAAKEDNVPNVNIERAIKKGMGALEGETAMEEVLYEAYGPSGTAYLIECLTENRNRALGNLRKILMECGGRVAEGGSVAWQFDRKGVVIAKCEMRNAKSEELQLQLIDFGAEDIDGTDGAMTVTTDVHHWASIRDFLRGKGVEVVTAGLKYVPQQKVTIANLATAKQVMALLDALEEDDDVSEVHTNADVPEEIAKELAK